MKKIKAFLAVLQLAVAMTSFAFSGSDNRAQCVAIQPPKVKMNITVMDINNTNHDGVTRITCDLEGVPHTSQRIDMAELFVKGKGNVALDIDGVDFERYFQWEDDGIIEIEIDFPLSKNISANDSIRFRTVHGIFTTKIGSAATAKRK